MGTDWVAVDDEKVRHVWECRNEDCPSKPSTAVSPEWYQDNGTPVCEECDRDMKYVRTEVLVPKGTAV